MNTNIDNLFELYWKSIQIPADDQMNWSSEESRELNKDGRLLMDAFKPTIRKAFIAGYEARQ